MSVHLFTVAGEPATRFDVGRPAGYKHIIRNPDHAPIRAHCCGKKRWAKNLIVKCYYDGTSFFCRPGKGCKKEK